LWTGIGNTLAIWVLSDSTITHDAKLRAFGNLVCKHAETQP
jgi:hypothetical protein